MHPSTGFVFRSIFVALTLSATLGVAAALVPAGSGQRPQPRKEGPAPRADVLATVPASGTDRSDGALILADGRVCPLRHTAVEAEIAGMLSRVTVTQQFENLTADIVEALYTFPLPSDAAVDDMTLRVGTRVVRGLIKRREEAKRIYDEAKQAGHTAALLDQERPNIFTQAVANIPPGAKVEVIISYVETLAYENGRFTFVFPMVVGPRYMPGAPTAAPSGGWAPGTTQVPDASRISPPVAGVHVGQKGSRAGHDISVKVTLDAGVAIQSLESRTHAVDVTRTDARSAVVALRNAGEIPNRDFVLDYAVAGGNIADAVIAHAMPTGDDSTPAGHFALILQPPDRVADEDATPRELVFVLDTSGSMSGYPIETAKAVMRRAIGSLRPNDTFNLITFAGDTRLLFPRPVQATAANVAQATAFLDGQHGGGGTEMMTAIRAALGDDTSGTYAPASARVTPGAGADECEYGHGCAGGERPLRESGAIRVVCFMTDGYVGNDMEIIGEVQKHADARVFSFGIGSSVNRFLLDGMARAGRGEVEYVLRAEAAAAAAGRFYERVHTPVLTDVTVDWGALTVTGVLPARVPDLFAARPVVVVGRYTGAQSGTITLRGLRAGRPYERTVRVALPASEPRHRAIGQLWARTQIAELRTRDWQGLQRGTIEDGVREEITGLGLRYRLMTEFTSFVAVEERTVVEGGTRRTVQVPVEMPAGVSVEGVFGNERSNLVAAQAMGGAVGKVSRMAMPSAPTPATVATAPTGSPREAVADRAKAERDERQDGRAKLHLDLVAIVSCLDRGVSAATCTARPDGRVHVRVTLAAAPSRETLAALARLGFVPDANGTSGATVVGTIDATKLDALGATTEVVRVAPVR